MDLKKNMYGWLMLLVWLPGFRLWDEESSQNLVPMPPSITVHPRSEIYRNADTITLECEATGVPDVEYYWKRDGLEFGFNRPNVHRISETKGSFEYGPLTTLDSGYFQCFASNLYGVALSEVAVVSRATMSYFPSTDDVQDYPVRQGQDLKVSCAKIKSFPPPLFTWSVADSVSSTNTETVVLDNRVQQDDTGNLYFANVLMTDYPDKIYKCNAYNEYVEVTTTGSYSKLNIQQETPVDGTPFLKYQTPDPVVALVGKDVKLKCIFAGYPTPLIKWSRSGGGSLPIGRHDKIDFDSALHIWDIREEDEGNYECEGHSKAGANKGRIALDVQMSPVFLDDMSRPHPMNKTNGETVSYLCDTKSEPKAEIKWLINGEPIDQRTPGPRRIMSADMKNLTITDLCKDCGNDETDLMVIQCNASNVHGYAYGAGYLNVLQCSGGKYGPDCSYDCSTGCKVSSECHNITGHCPCAEGYKGDTCREQCSVEAFEYGEDCKSRCSEHCGGNGSCDVYSGTCNNDICKEGYVGKYCSTETGTKSVQYVVITAVICALIAAVSVTGFVVLMKLRKRCLGSNKSEQQENRAETGNLDDMYLTVIEGDGNNADSVHDSQAYEDVSEFHQQDTLPQNEEESEYILPGEGMYQGIPKAAERDLYANSDVTVYQPLKKVA